MADVHDHDLRSKGPFSRRPGAAGRRLQPPRARSASSRQHPVYATAFRRDPSILRSLRRIKGRAEVESASQIIAFLARRGTDLQALRGVAEAIADFRPGPEAVRGLKVLRSAITKDRHAAVLLPAVISRNPSLLRAHTDSLIILGRMYPFISDSGIIGSLGPEDVEILAAAYRKTVSLFPRPEIEDVFFAVLNEKMRQGTHPAEKKRVASAWAETLISILTRIERREVTLNPPSISR
jgi:hypothetical protein